MVEDLNRHLTKEELQVGHQRRRTRCIVRRQGNANENNHERRPLHTHLSVAKIQNTDTPSAGQDGATGASGTPKGCGRPFSTSGMPKGTATLKDGLVVSSKTEYTLTKQPGNYVP